MNPGDIFNLLFLGPIINLLVLVLRMLENWHIPGALGFAIIILTVVIRALLWPLVVPQLRSSKKMAELKPHLDELQKNHKDNKQALAAAQMELYKKHGVNPVAGCLPSLLQLPIIYALYQTIQAVFMGGKGVEKINYFMYPFLSRFKLTHAPDLNFFGLNLSDKPSTHVNFLHLNAGWVFLLIPVLTGLFQFVQSKMMMPNRVKPYPSDSKQELAEKGKQEDTSAAMQSQMLYMMPLLIGYLSWQFPFGLSLYWNTLTLVSIVQQYFISGWGGVSSLLPRRS